MRQPTNVSARAVDSAQKHYDLLARSRSLAGVIHHVPTAEYNGIWHPLVLSGMPDHYDLMRMGIYQQRGSSALRFMLQPLSIELGVPIYQPQERSRHEVSKLADSFIMLSGLLTRLPDGSGDFELFGHGDETATPIAFLGDDPVDAAETFMYNIGLGIVDTVDALRKESLERAPGLPLHPALVDTRPANARNPNRQPVV